jgi:uncharacterized membrane protein YecN with MAPEG domain
VTPSIVPIYAAALGVMFVILSLRVIRLRHRTRIGLGSSGSVLLERRIRVQGNFAEYVPFSLILLAFAELQAWPAWLINALGLILLGRVLHAVGVGMEHEDFRLRITGMAMTFGVLGTASTLLLVSPLLG